MMFVSVLALTVVLFAGAAPAYAAELNRGGPQGSPDRGGGNSGGGNGQSGQAATGTGVPLETNQDINLENVMSDTVHTNLATALGLTVDELEARVDAGETLADIALSLGFDYTAISDMLAQARSDALAQAVADDLITQEQADWVASHGNQNPAASYGDGICLEEECLENNYSGEYGQGHYGDQNH